MERKKRLLKWGILTCLAVGTAALGGFGATAVKGTDLTAVDLKKGVTGQYDESGSIQSINLNGNSVILADSDNSTDDAKFCNIYLDKNRNGVIDEGEDKVSLDGETDINMQIPIYGVYQQKSVTPISITVLSGDYTAIYGVYEGELNTSDTTAPACTITVQGGKIVGCVSAAWKSNILAAAPNAVDMNITDGNINACIGIQEGSITAKGDTQPALDMDISGGKISSCIGVKEADVITSDNSRKAVSIDVTGDTAISSVLMGVNGNISDTRYKILGDIELRLTPSAMPKSGSNFSVIYGAYQNMDVDGSVIVSINHASVTSMLALVHNNCTVSGDALLTGGEDVFLYQIALLSSSTIEGNVEADVYGDMRETPTGDSMRAVNGAATGKDYAVGGSLVITIQDGAFNDIYGATSSEIKGNVDISLKKGSCINFYGLQGAVAKGDVTLISDRTTTFSNGFTGCGGSTSVKGAVTVDIYNTISNSYCSFYGINCSNVEKAVNVTLHGGTYSGCFGVYADSTNQFPGGCKIQFEDITVNNSLSGTQNGAVIGDVAITMTNCSGSAYMYGIQGTKVTGNGTLTMTDCNMKSYVYGIYNADITGEVIENLTNVSAGSYSMCGMMTSTVGGNATMEMKGSSSDYLYGINNNCQISGEIDVTIDSCTAKGYLYVIYNSKGKKSATVNCLNNQAASFYGLNSCEIAGNVQIKTNGDNSEQAGTGDYYGLNSGSVGGSVTLDTINCQYQSYNGINYTSNAGNVRITMDGGTYSGVNIHPYMVSGGSGKNQEVTILCKNAAFTSTSTYAAIRNGLSEGQQLTMTIEDSCTLTDVYNIYANTNNGGDALVTCQDNYYYAGSYPITQDVTAKNIYIGNLANGGGSYANILIPKGVTMEATEAVYLANCGGVLLEGTLNGKLNQEDSNYQHGSIFFNGGVMAAAEEVENRYYPLTISYLEKGGTVSVTSNITTNKLRPDKYFGLAGKTPTLTCTAKKGYTLTSTSVTKEGSDAPEILSDTGDGKYSFDMADCGAEVQITFTGRQIVLGKTVSDPVAQLNKKTTSDAPLYDMADVTISNDGKEGTVSYEVDDVYGLPEGLKFQDGKIFGTPTKAYEKGKKTIIHVTGRNDTISDLSLNIIVTAEGAEQSGQEGRIAVDEENQVINLLGNSVVIQEYEGGTGIFIDDNRDGAGDKAVPVYSGDLSAYTINGIQDTEVTRPARITMTGGVVDTLRGALNTELTVDKENALEMRIKGGTVSNCIGIDASTVKGSIALVVDSDAACNSISLTANNATNTGSYLNRKGTVTITGTYAMKDSVTVNSISISSSSTVTIPEDVAINVTGNTSTASNAVVYHKGSFGCAGSFSNNGKWYVQGGKFTEENTWSNLYYPVTPKTNITNTSITLNSNIAVLTVNGEKQYYAIGGGVIGGICTSVSGYDYYISVDGSELVKAGSTFTYEMPRKEAIVQIEYVPTDIHVEKRFADPTGTVGTVYTEESPLYDFSLLEIENDTVSPYGGEIHYTIKKSTPLPEGLSLTNGKLVGTPVKANEKGQRITVTVTGRNGATADISIIVTIIKDDYTKKDINDMVKVSGTNIDLQGTSVVILASAGDSSKTSIYLDENRDGIADNDKALLINGETACDLSNSAIFGYRDSTKTYQGDISICMYGGIVRALYGVYGTNNTNPTTVAGDVMVSIQGGSVNSQAAGGYYASADSLNLDILGGSFNGSIWGACYPKDVQTVSLRFQGKAKLKGTYSTKGKLYATQGGNVLGDVDVQIGVQSSAYGFDTTYFYTYYYGVYNTTVGGSVDYIQNGWWNPEYVNYYACNSNIAGNLNVDWRSGQQGKSKLICAYNGTISGDIVVNVAENADAGGTVYLGQLCTVNNIKMNVPQSNSGSIKPTLVGSSSSSKPTIKGYGYVDNKGDVEIAGNYTIEEDLKVNRLNVNLGAKVTIAEGAVLENTDVGTIDGTIFNKGTWNCRCSTTLGTTGIVDNYGTLSIKFDSTTSFSYIMTISSGGMIINRESASCEIGYSIYNQGKIINYGLLKQTNKSTSIGTVYTTTLPNLGYQLSRYSTIYYAVTLDYPKYCIDSVSVTNSNGSKLVSSYVSGDNNQYLKGGAGFIVNTGTVIEGITLSTVIYGSSNTGATTSDNTKWTGTLGYEPTTITLNFDGTDPITLTKTEDTVSGLTVGVYTSASKPAYDITKVGIEGDTVIAGGYVSYSVDSSAPLPKGLRLENGKIYGTPQKASDEPQISKIIVKGKNQTSAVLTLTFMEIAKGTPGFSIPSNLSAKAGDTLAQVVLPTRYNGVYSWPDETVPVGEEAGTNSFELYFTPNDTADYDWSKVTNGTFDGKKVTMSVKVNINKIVPEYTVPENLTAAYGDTLKDVVLPSDENGTFTWS